MVTSHGYIGGKLIVATRTKKNVKAENNDQAFMGALEDLCKE